MIAVLRKITINISEWALRDFIIYYNSLETNHLIFNAPNGDIAEHYYDIPTSVKVCIDLLKFQFDNDEDYIKIFVEGVYNICEKLEPKRNSLFIYSPPNAGKNFFFDMVTHFYLNFGQLGNFNKYCN